MIRIGPLWLQELSGVAVAQVSPFSDNDRSDAGDYQCWQFRHCHNSPRSQRVGLPQLPVGLVSEDMWSTGSE